MVIRGQQAAAGGLGECNCKAIRKGDSSIPSLEGSSILPEFSREVIAKLNTDNH